MVLANRRLAAVDRFSRKVVACCPLEGPNAGRVVGAMEEAFAKHGAPRHLITDQEGVFICDVFRDLLIPRDIKHRFGAVGKHGSITVTERVIPTLKQEWLRRVPVIRGHSTLGGAVPSLIHRGEHWTRPARSAKAIPVNVDRRVFADTQIVAYRLAA